MQHVQFSDSSESVIITVFCSPQDPEYWENLGEVDDDDPRYIDFKERNREP